MLAATHNQAMHNQAMHNQAMHNQAIKTHAANGLVALPVLLHLLVLVLILISPTGGSGFGT